MPAKPRRPKLTPKDVVDTLAASVGYPAWRPHGDPMSELVLTLLSQNTADANSGRAFSRLLGRFPDWQSVLDAPVGEIEDAIRPGGLAPTKAPRLKAMLSELHDRAPGFDLSFLKELPLGEARQWLRDLTAVGPKTAACVLVFALGRPALPVDTHVYRVAQRLGLISSKLTPEKAQESLERTVAEEDQYAFHVLLIRHGRHTCMARSPACNRCPLRERCPSAAVLAPKGSG